MMSCYRDASVLMHAGVAISDAVVAARGGRIAESAKLIFRRSVAISLMSVVREAGKIRRLARVKARPEPSP
jgi:hypothetical protein